MNASRLISSLKLFYTLFIVPPKEWKLPKKSEILVYDARGAEALAPYLVKYRVTVMAVRGESICVPCLLHAMLKLKFWKGRLPEAYAKAFIQAVSPKIIITFVDNDRRFYTISKHSSAAKTLFIQNGLRGGRTDVFERLVRSESYHVDHMLVFGAAVGRKYKAYITGSVLPIGSFRNNTAKKTNIVTDGSVLVISQYRDKPKNNAPLLTVENEKSVPHDQYFSAEVIALRFIAKWCIENQKSLKIAGASVAKAGPETDFFEVVLSGYAWEYIPKIGHYSSYKLVDAAEIVVFIDSTLGYESIARGKKTASFSCRGVSLNDESRKFGWPADLPNNGPFWTNDQDEMQFQRIMDYLNTVDDEEWEKTRQYYSTELMEFDPGNKRFIALLDQLLPGAVKPAGGNASNLLNDSVHDL